SALVSMFSFMATCLFSTARELGARILARVRREAHIRAVAASRAAAAGSGRRAPSRRRVGGGVAERAVVRLPASARAGEEAGVSHGKIRRAGAVATRRVAQKHSPHRKSSFFGMSGPHTFRRGGP